ncbi:MAG: AAA family ATPase [Woeseiaceae bacterium]|nr:AAA family ATPase [Woeseiaceae bacterium]
MSKLQTALQKLTESHSRESQSAREVASVKSALRSERRKNGVAQLEPRQSIEIDYEMLASEGVAIHADFERQLRDEMRRIKWPVLANAFGEQSESIERSNVVMVASSTSGEGKTFTAINLAMSIATEKDFDVLLVDADIAKPHASKMFGLAENAGVTDFLADEVSDVRDIIVGTDVPGLCILPAGRADEHASELIASSRMADLVSILSENLPSTVVLFDTSPILQTNESQVLSRLVGQVLLVVAANQTLKPAVQEAVSLLGDVDVVNIVFNGMKHLFGQKHRYGGYYGYHYRN